MGKRLDYSLLIHETAEELRQLEKRQKKAIFRDRLRFLRLLKEAKATTQQEAADAIGIVLRQAQRYWTRYRSGGLDELLKPIRSGRTCRLSTEEQASLEERLTEDDMQSLQQSAKMIDQQFGVSYTPPGVYYLFKRLKIKKKTGRPVNINQDRQESEAFKKNSRR